MRSVPTTRLSPATLAGAVVPQADRASVETSASIIGIVTCCIVLPFDGDARVITGLFPEPDPEGANY
ncbi:hypothetical protein J2858_003096 [Neorhizobium galegae]|uniref:hypothetical protein n=1 Tax=Neorhizobium galegae TaxID=399 RepID=UPI001AE80136|nr:hypothetical protein [Neorhizobium galegae]MBP2550160.1 hypothetical protein [Neorhizobium galegae]